MKVPVAFLAAMFVSAAAAQPLSSGTTLGDGTGTSHFIIDGGGSGSDGAIQHFRSNHSPFGFIGNKSAIVGGAFDPTLTLYAQRIMFYAGNAEAVRITPGANGAPAFIGIGNAPWAENDTPLYVNYDAGSQHNNSALRVRKRAFYGGGTPYFVSSAISSKTEIGPHVTNFEWGGLFEIYDEAQMRSDLQNVAMAAYAWRKGYNGSTFGANIKVEDITTNGTNGVMVATEFDVNGKPGTTATADGIHIFANSTAGCCFQANRAIHITGDGNGWGHWRTGIQGAGIFKESLIDTADAQIESGVALKMAAGQKIEMAPGAQLSFDPERGVAVLSVNGKSYALKTEPIDDAPKIALGSLSFAAAFATIARLLQ